MRILVLVVVVVSHVAFAAPSTCPASEKRFKCHQLALHAHLSGDVATARALYRDACDRGEAASCNNLGVLALTHPEIADGIDPKALFDKACARLEQAACDNAHRLPTYPDLTNELALGDTELTIGADAWRRLVADACRAGDVSRCEEATQQARIAAMLADDCRKGTRTSCFEAASRTTDDAKAAALLAIGCTGHDGRACHALATRKAAAGAKDTAIAELWKGACADNDWTATPDDAAARTDACVHWGKTARGTDRTRAAGFAADACDGCLAAAQLYDLAGDHAKAYAMVERQCTELGQTDACRALGERIVLGNGTRADIAKGLEQLGNTCPDGLAWSTCKRIGQWLVAQARPVEAANAYGSYCDAGNQEACYLRARAYEADPNRGCMRGLSLDDLAKAYDDLCKQGNRAACGARPRLCARAMDEDAQHHQCMYGIGDGSTHHDLEDLEVLDLCPKSSWTPAVRKRMQEYDDECRQAKAWGASCDP